MTILEAIEEVSVRRMLSGDRGVSIEQIILRGEGSFDVDASPVEGVAANLLGL